MIRECTMADLETVESIINEAARAYQGAVPADCLHDPYMSRPQLLSEIHAGVHFWGLEDSGVLVGVMGIQQVRDATLIRHAYVRKQYQGLGIGGELIHWIIAQARRPLLVGTWAAAAWAIRFYERHGFKAVAGEDRQRLLETYWTIPARQRDVSVVLIYERS
jgi:GNAT superfamily N-acetyltransferase